jgi:hypothetical protein
MIAACARELPSSESPDYIGTLTAELAVLNLQNPVADLDGNLLHGDPRFVCLYGFATYFPGVPDSQTSAVAKYGQRCFAGSSDTIDGEAHSALIHKAKEYAKTYNGELLKRINDGVVK